MSRHIGRYLFYDPKTNKLYECFFDGKHWMFEDQKGNECLALFMPARIEFIGKL